MQTGDVKIFTKSGNEVRLLEPVFNSEPRAWLVERTKGESAGKQMMCFEHCLFEVTAEVQQL